MGNKYWYRVYGLRISSNIEILEFQEEENMIDDEEIIYILKDKIPEEIKAQWMDKRSLIISKENIWLDVKEVAMFWIHKGKKVIIEPYENYDENRMKNYIMGSVLGFLLLQRDEVAIHGGTVVIDGKAVVITGKGGSGKSTLTLTLGRRGHKYLADDIAAVSLNNGLQVEPGFPYHKLCLDVVEKLNYDKSKLTTCKGAKEMKYVVPDLSGFMKESMPLKAICEISEANVEHIEVKELEKSEKINHIIKNIYRSENIGAMGGLTPQCFKKYLKVAKEIKYYRILRPKDKNTIEELANIVEGILN